MCFLASFKANNQTRPTEAAPIIGPVVVTMATLATLLGLAMVLLFARRRRHHHQMVKVYFQNNSNDMIGFIHLCYSTVLSTSVFNRIIESDLTFM